MTTLNTMISAPTMRTVIVWPRPHSAPISVVSSEPAAAVEDRGDRDDVVRIGRVAHAEQEPESGKGEQLRHPSLRVRLLQPLQ